MSPERQPPEDRELFLLEAWVADNPGSRLFIKLAEGYETRGELERAAAVLDRGLAVHPGEIDARRVYARVLRGLGREDASLEQLELAAAELSRFAGVFDDLAAMYTGQGQDQAAAQAGQVARALAGDEPATASGRAARPAATPARGGGAMLRRLEALRKAAASRAE